MLVFDLDDYFGVLTDVTTIPSQVGSTSEQSAHSSSEMENFKLRSNDNGEDEAVAAVRPGDKSAYIESPIWWGDDNSATEGVRQETTTPAQIELPEPKTDRSAYIESSFWWGDELAIEAVVDNTTIQTDEMNKSA